MKTNLGKKIAALVLTLCMVLTILPAMPLMANATEYTEGYNGVPVTPGKISASNYRSFGLTDGNWSRFNGYYGIRTASELYGFADVVNNGNRTASALLLKDIVINTGKVTESGSSSGTTYEWIPIGVNRDVSFLGNFEGNGHTISGLYFNELERECVGLFGLIGEAVQNNSVKIQNVTLANSFIRSGENIGGIVGTVLGY